MPVSPADFEFYSRMTGQPIPNTPAGRMAIAPQVYNMRRGGGGFGRMLGGAARGALAAGALAGAAALAASIDDDKKQEAEKKTSEAAAKKAAKEADLRSAEEKREADLRGIEERRSDYSRQLPSAGMRSRAAAQERAKDPSRQLPSSNMLAARLRDTEAQKASVRDRADDFLAEVEQGVTDEATGAGRQGFLADSGEERVGQLTPEKLREVQEFRNRYSGQTQIPVASPDVENESVAAQSASVQEPTEPRLGLRQNPSSGVIQTDLSNVAATEGGRPAMAAPGLESQVAQATEFFEGSPGQSPFQASGAMEELRRQSMDVKKTVGDLPGSIRGDVAIYLSNLQRGSAAPAPTSARSVAQEFQQQLGRMSERDQVQYQGGLTGKAPQGVYGNLEAGAADMGDAPLGGMSSSKELMSGMLERGNVLPSGIPQTKTNVPGPIDPVTGDYRPFVSNKGREIGALLKQSQEKKAPAPTLKEIAGDALNLLNPFKGKKVDPREQQIRSDVDRQLGTLSAEQRENEVRRRLNQ